MRRLSGGAARLAWRACAALACLWFPFALLAAPTYPLEGQVITEIRFEGNDKTRPETMLREMVIEEGDPVDMERIERSRQAIMDLDLFESVTTRLIPEEEGRGRILEITVDEKWYILPLPSLNRNADGDLRYGADIDITNLNGLNQELEISATRTELAGGDVDEERNIDVFFDWPRIGGGPYELTLNLGVERAFLEEERDGATGDFEQDSALVRVLVSRWANVEGPSRGWLWTLGVHWERFDTTFIEGDPSLFFDATDTRLIGAASYTDVHNLTYNRVGRQYGYEAQGSLTEFGADKDFIHHFLFYRRYKPVTSRPYTNLNYQLRAGLATDTVFGDRAYDLGSSTTIRGYDRDSIEGNAFLLANFEALTPVLDYNSLRAAAFVDVGDAWDDYSDATLSDLKWGVGFGFRWKVRKLVRVDLRADLAYGINDGQLKGYAGTRATF